MSIPASEPTGRYRVHYQWMVGWSSADFGSYTTAVRYAKSLIRSHWAYHVRVLKEFESSERVAADFRQVWP